MFKSNTMSLFDRQRLLIHPLFHHVLERGGSYAMKDALGNLRSQSVSTLYPRPMIYKLRKAVITITGLTNDKSSTDKTNNVDFINKQIPSLTEAFPNIDFPRAHSIEFDRNPISALNDFVDPTSGARNLIFAPENMRDYGCGNVMMIRTFSNVISNFMGSSLSKL